MTIDSATIKLTLRCNDRCEFCYQHQNYLHELTLKEIQTMIDTLKHNGCHVLLLSGGEPLLRDDITEIISYANSCGMITKLATNGLLADKARIHALRDSGLDELYISLGDMTDFGKLERLLSLKRELKDFDFKRLCLGVNVITSRTFVKQADICLEWLHKLGIFLVFLIPPKPSLDHGWYEKEKMQVVDYIQLSRSMIHWQEKMIFIKDCAFQLMSQIMVSEYAGQPEEEFNCPAVKKGITIASTGMVYPCGFFEQVAYCAGNLTQTCLSELLLSEGFKRFADLKSQAGLWPPCLHFENAAGAL